MIHKPVKAEAINPYSIHVKYEDQTEGIWDVSYLLAKPIFKKWADPDFFCNVHIDTETYAIAWDEDIEICPDTLYLNIKGLLFEHWKSAQASYAT